MNAIDRTTLPPAPASPDPGAPGPSFTAQNAGGMLAALAEIDAMTLEAVRAAHGLAMHAIAHETDLYRAAAAATPAGEAPPPIKERPSSPALMMSFARIARMVRQGAAEEAKAEAAPKPAAAEPDRKMSSAARRRLTAMKNEVRQQVECSIRAHAEPLLVDRLLLDLDERLDDPDVEAEFGVLTTGQMVLSVCHDLRVKPELAQWPEPMLQSAISAHYGTPMPPAAAPHGMTKGLAADPTVEKLPTGVIGSPGVPPAIDLPPWSNQPPPQQPPQPTPPDAQRNASAVQDAPAAPRRPPGSFFAR
jgi:hypothetical protein